MREQIAEYLREIPIRNRKDFFEVLNLIAPLADGWALAEPMSARKIMRFASAKVRAKSYVDFTIPKKSGGERKISAPIKDLKAIQTAINILLQSLFIPSPHATGFVIGKSIKENAMMHVGQTCIFNTDLGNFFPSITKKMVRKALHSELGNFLGDNDVINIICRLCTVPNSDGIEVLPQGAPTSPVLSNIVLKSLDEEMVRLSERMGCRYSRYADDITLSHSKAISRMSPFWLQKIRKVIENHGLTINEKKTKTFVPGIRREVTGVVVSDKINVSRTYVKQVRTLLHLWEKYGYKRAQAIFVKDFCKGISKNLVNVIDGKINYLEMIKGKEDPTYRKYNRKLKRLQWLEKQSKTIKNKAV